MEINKRQTSRITFEEFKEFANDSNLSRYEKIGFPDDYRAGKEINIFKDLNQKLKLDRNEITILDIGCGCSDLVNILIDNAETKKQNLILVDSDEMLQLSKENKFTKKIAGKFPDCYEDLQSFENQVDVIVVYSVLQHIVLDSNPYGFIDKALELLKPEGYLLIGDIPNFSKRNRFFQSKRGHKFHQDYIRSASAPVPNTSFPDSFEKIDDGLLFGILHRYRGLGFETYIVPQNNDLPMSNRREDVLIFKN